MADVAPTPANELGVPNLGGRGSTTLVYSLTNSDADTEVIKIGANWVDATIQIDGTFDGATVVVKQTNDDDANWLTANDTGGSAMSYTSAPTELVAPALLGRQMQIVSTGGSGSQAVAVRICIRTASN